jgi:hypothetical protein
VECRVVQPNAQHRVPVTIWNTGKKPLHVGGAESDGNECACISAGEK